MCGHITQQLSPDLIGELYGVQATPLPAARRWLARVWQQRGRGKQPYFLTLKDGSPLSFAALWERWDKGSGTLETFTIITTAASPGLEDIHHRQPAIIAPRWLSNWLDPRTPLPALLELARELHDGPFERRAVSTRVNSVRNDDPDVLLPVSDSVLF